MIAAHSHAIEMREGRIAELEAELDRRANVITTLANLLSRANYALVAAGRSPIYPEADRQSRERREGEPKYMPGLSPYL